MQKKKKRHRGENVIREVKRGLHGHTIKKHNAPNPHDHLVTACYVQSETKHEVLFFLGLFFSIGHVCISLLTFSKQSHKCDGAYEGLTWEGCRVEPCGNKLPRRASVVWRAASATHTFCFSEAAPPAGRSEDTQPADLSHLKCHMLDFI